jgi:VanZ family protein
MPFIMLQNYLQLTLRNTAGQIIDIFGIGIPLVLLIVIPPLLALLFVNIKKITRFRLLTLLFVIAMLFVGQSVSDFYVNFKFYDLQNNWHYLAYCFFTVISYRYLSTKDVPIHRIIIITFLRGLAISLFDEGVQVFISNRVFDLSDVAKDMWGLWLGNILIFFFIGQGEVIKQFKIRQKKLKDYIKSPYSLIALQGLFTFEFLFFSANLTNSIYWLQLTVIVLSAALITFFCIHLSQRKLFFRAFIIFFAALAIALGTSFVINKDKGLMSIGNNFIVYKGIPLPYFDVLITSDGFFRFVDKKSELKKGDLSKLNDFYPDIILFALTNKPYVPNQLASVNPMKNTYFLYNHLNGSGIQVVVRNYKDAIDEYNRIRMEKNAIIVIHNGN